YNGSPTTITGLPTYSTNTGASWLQVSQTGLTGVVMVTVNPALLTTTSDTGNVFVPTLNGQANFQVVVNGNGSSSGLAASQNPITIGLPVGSGISTQNVNVTYNGSPVTIQAVSASTANAQSWLSAFNGGSTGSVSVTVNPTILSAGYY